MMIGDLEVRELPIKNGQAVALWEVVAPSSGRVAESLNFAVFASYVSDPAANLPSLGAGLVAGGFAPIGMRPGSPVPHFGMNTLTRSCGILTIVP